jgi:hypothetical protein
MHDYTTWTNEQLLHRLEKSDERVYGDIQPVSVEEHWALVFLLGAQNFFYLVRIP